MPRLSFIVMATRRCIAFIIPVPATENGERARGPLFINAVRRKSWCSSAVRRKDQSGRANIGATATCGRAITSSSVDGAPRQHCPLADACARYAELRDPAQPRWYSATESWPTLLMRKLAWLCNYLSPVWDENSLAEMITPCASNTACAGGWRSAVMHHPVDVQAGFILRVLRINCRSLPELASLASAALQEMPP